MTITKSLVLMAVLWLGTSYACSTDISCEAAKCGLDMLLSSARNQLLCLVGDGRGGANDCNDHSSTQAGKFDCGFDRLGTLRIRSTCKLLASKTCDMCI